MTCMTAKCAKRAGFNFEDEPFPKFCELHKYEGMIEVTGVITHQEPFLGIEEEGNAQDVGEGVGGVDKSNEAVNADDEWKGKGKGKKVVKKSIQQQTDEPKKGPGRPSSGAKLAKHGKGLKSIERFFSPQSAVKCAGEGGKTKSNTTELSTLEYKLVYVDGLSRAEARHVAMATMAS